MNINNINNADMTAMNYKMHNNNIKDKTDTGELKELTAANDYVEFSVDYSKKDVSKILDNIQNSFDKDDSSGSISDCGEKYGKILKDISSNSKFDDKTKDELTKKLDNSFDKFAKKRAKGMTDNMSNFFDSAYTSEKGGNKLGITGEELFTENDKNESEKNIKNMFTATEVFYKNNLDGTKVQLDAYLQENFNKTENIGKLSYKDVKALENSKTINNSNQDILSDISISGYAKRKADAMNNSLESLNKDGASDILFNAYSKAIDQNNNKDQRIEAYWTINFSFQQESKLIGNSIEDNTYRLKELKEKRQEVIKEYNKQMEKIKKDMTKFAMMKNNGQSNMLEEMEKAHKSQLENMDKLKTEIENQQKQLKKQYNQTGDSYDKFMEDPSASINSYLQHNIDIQIKK